LCQSLPIALTGDMVNMNTLCVRRMLEQRDVNITGDDDVWCLTGDEKTDEHSIGVLVEICQHGRRVGWRR